MVRFFTAQPAFGSPGIEPRWTHADKAGVGTAYSIASRIWYTIWNGIVTEVYYPTIDQPQIRDLQYLVTDGNSFFHEETRDLHSKVEKLSPNALGYRVTNRDPNGRYTLIKEIISDPYSSCVLQRTNLTGEVEVLAQLKFYVLCAPHLNVGGWGNTARVIEVVGQKLLIAQKQDTWLALGATVPFLQLSCGYVGQSDGWHDLADNFQMDWEFDQAKNGNVALTGELDWQQREFVLGLSFGNTLHNAVSTLFQSLEIPFKKQQDQFKSQWQRAYHCAHPLESMASDGGNLYNTSFNLILAHEDKLYPGALIASLAIPWGQTKGDQDTPPIDL